MYVASDSPRAPLSCPPHPKKMWMQRATDAGFNASPAPPKFTPGDVVDMLKVLPHAVDCRESHCRVRFCPGLKKIVLHANNCQHDHMKQRNQCSKQSCKQYVLLCSNHAHHCNAKECGAPYCSNFNSMWRRRRDASWREGARIWRLANPTAGGNAGQ
jgi:hypothetical protein